MSKSTHVGMVTISTLVGLLSLLSVSMLLSMCFVISTLCFGVPIISNPIVQDEHNADDQ